MRKMMLLPMAAAAAMLLSTAPIAQAQVAEATNLTAQAIKELADYPGKGKRETAYVAADDFFKNWGADVSQIKKATAILQDALGKARSGNATKMGIFKLEEAVRYCSSTMHKECRLMAQGALRHLCQGGGSDEKNKDACDKAPKFGSYVAP